MLNESQAQLATLTSRKHTATSAILCATVPGPDGEYVYDVYSNRILRLDRTELAILQGLADDVSPELIAERLDSPLDKAGRMDLVSRFRSTLKQLEVLQPMSPRTVVPFGTEVDHAYLDHQLSHHLSGLVLGVTERCSFRCKYCVFGGMYQTRRRHSGLRMSLTTAKQAVQFLLARSGHAKEPLAFSFYGGEPLLEFRLIERIVGFIESEIGHRAHGFHLTTNGLALEQQRIRDFLANHQVSLTVSLDGPQAIHDAWRVTQSGQPTHARLIAALERFQVGHPEYYSTRVRFISVLTHPFLASDMVEYFSGTPLFRYALGDLKVAALDWRGLAPDSSLVITVPRAGVSKARPTIRERYIVNRLREVRPNDGLDGLWTREMARIAQRNIGKLPPVMRPRGYCIPGVRKLYVGATGTLGMCEKVAELIPIGHLSTGFDQIHIRRILGALTSLWSGRCTSCIAQRFCGMCPEQVWESGSTPSTSRFEETCSANIQGMIGNLKMFVELCCRNPAFLKYLQEDVVLS